MNLLAWVGFTAHQQGIGNNSDDNTFDSVSYMEDKSPTNHVSVFIGNVDMYVNSLSLLSCLLRHAGVVLPCLYNG